MPALFIILALIAAGMIVALVVGVMVKLIGLLVLALVVVAGVSWMMSKITGREADGLAVLNAHRGERRDR